MYFDDLNNLITMAGHGPYVWAAYGTGLVVLGWNLFSPILQGRRVRADIRRRLRREQAMQEARP